MENYLEPYHIPTIHPDLSKQVDMTNYAVHVDEGFVEHIVPTTNSSSYGGVWIWHSPTLAINCYDGGMSLERIVPTGPDTTEIHYVFLFNKQHQQQHDSSDASRLAAIRTTTEVLSLSLHCIYHHSLPCLFLSCMQWLIITLICVSIRSQRKMSKCVRLCS